MKMPRKYIGAIGWTEPAHTDEASVDRAIQRSADEIVVDFLFDGQRYTVSLLRTGGNEFRGKYATQRQGNPYEGEASCRLYSSSDGAFLFGRRWSEDRENYIWWADLETVGHFPDENRATRRP